MKQNNNFTVIEKGLHLDRSPHAQPKGTYRYGLNLVDETFSGDLNFINNEESDFLFTSLTEDFIPLGKVYIGDKKFVVWSISKDEQVSEIGILDIKLRKYTPQVNDADTLPEFKLHFSLRNPIQAVYRLRGGCDITVYWVDKKSPARYFNFSKPENFKNSAGNWVANKFNLQRTYEKIPNFNKIDIIEIGGRIEPGSYNFTIQLVDADLNPTEWITTTPVVKIYNDFLTKEYSEIHGAINSDQDVLNFPVTNKAISLELSNLDTNYPYFRIGIIMSNNGSGVINKVVYSDIIPTQKPTFIFNGQNFLTEGSALEVAMFNNIIGVAEHIEQIENRLILGGIEGDDKNLCVLQRYASQIQTDCITKKIILNSLSDEANSKHPTADFNGGAGYMPGEIYAKGIVYIFEDSTLSPVFHIPGKPLSDADVTYTQGDNVYPMSANNACENTYYNENNNTPNYWGTDYTGTPLLGKKVRHHRLPLRSEINLPLVEDSFGKEFVNKYYTLNLAVNGLLKLPVPCPEDEPKCGTDKYYTAVFRVDYKVDGENYFFTQTLDPNAYANNVDTSVNIGIIFNSRYHSSNNITDITISVGDENNIYKPLGEVNLSLYFLDTPDIKTSIQENISTVQDRIVESNILGIRHTNIKKPSKEELNGKEVIGYYIVRLERTEFDKTILDSAVLFPTVVNNKYISHGLLQPQTADISKNVYGVLHPEYKFKGREYPIFDRVIQEGNYKVVDRKLGKINYDDVYDGSAYNKKYHKDGNDDGHDADGSPTSRGYDGWSFNLITRDNIVSYDNKKEFTIDKTQIKDFFYLEALESKSINDFENEVYNIASDNKIGILQTTEDDVVKGNMPYVVFAKDNSDPYTNYRTLPYYKETVNPIYFENDTESTVNIFAGDTYITPMRYVNTVYWDNRVADRAGKKSVLKIIIGVVGLIAGAILTATGIGAGAGALAIGASITLFGAGVLYASSGIKMANFNKAYAEEYEKGLRQTALDSWTDMFYNYKNNIPFGFEGNGRHGYSGPSDDTIQWAADCVTDLWFESSINMNLRHKFAEDQSPTFLSAPGKIESGNTSKIRTWEFFGRYLTDSNSQRYPVSSLERHVARKLLAYDDTRDDNRYYLGAALGEYYKINPDYERTNKEKAFYHLPAEYNCCSKCQESFPHRFFWSEQSFQEEISDNYRIFLPNNYKDIDGSTGPITNIFNIGESLYVHTREALWSVPRNQQERVTGEVISFIGTGEYFSIPPRKVIDDETGYSAGLQHKWASVKTPLGVFFISENQRRVFSFSGKYPEPISSKGLSSWFLDNTEILNDKNYYKKVEEEYPFKDNPTNPYGTGYHIAYDGEKERVVFTKIDNILDVESDSKDKYSMKDGKLVVFKNYIDTLKYYEEKGWSFDKELNGQLIFTRLAYSSYTYNVYTPSGGIVQKVGSMPEDTFLYINGEEVKVVNTVKNSWTISYSIKRDSWLSWHSYFPRFSFSTPGFLITNDGDEHLYKHNLKGSYNTFRGVKYPSVIEYISFANPSATTVVNGISFNTVAERYFEDSDSFVEEPNITFNSLMVYNSNQNSGQLTLVQRDNEEDYLWSSVQNLSLNEIFVNKSEKDWNVNQLRDIRVNYKVPMFTTNIQDRQDGYYIDKVLKEDTLDYSKDWSEMESFRDKFLAVRLTFNNFENVKLSFNYSVTDEEQSYR